MTIAAGVVVAGRAELLAPASDASCSPLFRSAWTVRDRDVGIALGVVVDSELVNTPGRREELLAIVDGLRAVSDPSLMAPVAALPHEDQVLVLYGAPATQAPAPSHPSFGDAVVGADRAVDVARALAALHRADRVHGALSLHAVSYTATGAHVWMYGITGGIDSGAFAKRCRDATLECPYPPEFLAFGGKPSQRTDVFAWGVVAAQLVTGRKDVGVAKDVNAGLTLGPEHPLIRVLKSCLNENASARPRDAVELLGRLEGEGLGSRTDMAPPPAFGSMSAGLGPAPPPPSFNTSADQLPALESWDAEHSVMVDTPAPGSLPAISGGRAGVDRSARAPAPSGISRPGSRSAKPPPPPSASSRAPNARPPSSGRTPPPPPPSSNRGRAQAIRRGSTPPPPPPPSGTAKPVARQSTPPPPPDRPSSRPAAPRAAPQPAGQGTPAPAAPPGPGAEAFARALDRAVAKRPKGAGALADDEEADAEDDGSVDVLSLARGDDSAESSTGRPGPSRSGAAISGLRKGLAPGASADGRVVADLARDIPRTAGPHGLDGSWVSVPIVAVSIGLLGLVGYGVFVEQGGVRGLISDDSDPVFADTDTDGGTTGPATTLPDVPAPEPVAIDCPTGMRELSEDVCIDATEAPGRRRLPTTDVSLGQAAAECAKRGARLCTASEWEAGCRGPKGEEYPYGGSFKPSCNLASAAGFAGTLAPAGQHLSCVSGVGALDMLGNVGEWVKGGYAMGGDYGAPRSVDCTSKGKPPKGFKGPNVGFRCCMDRWPVETERDGGGADQSAAAG